MHPLLPALGDGSATVLVRRDALAALLDLFDGFRYGPRGHEPTAEQRDAGIGTCLTAEHLQRLDKLTDTAEGHEIHLRLVLNGETPTGICASCARYTALTGLALACDGSSS